MITLDELQKDALSEIFNIGVGRAANALSQMLGGEIALTSPSVQLMPIADVRLVLANRNAANYSAVTQHFSGPFQAEAVLVFPESNALVIVTHMLGNHLPPEELAEYEQEVMCEVGNIILNACVSILSDLFHVEFSGGLPNHQYGAGDIFSIHLPGYMDHVLVLHVQMIIQKQNIEGQLLYLLSVESLQQLIEHLNRYLEEQGLK